LGIVHCPDLPARLLAMNADGSRMACCQWSIEGTPAKPTTRAGMMMLDAARDRPLWSLAAEPGRVFWPPVLSLDGRWLAVGNAAVTEIDKSSFLTGETYITLFDASTGREIRTLEGKHNRMAGALAFSPDGAMLASVDFDGQVLVRDVATGRLRYPALSTSTALTGVTFSPDSRRLAVNGYDGLVRLWDATTGNLLLTLRGFELPGDGNYAFVGRVVFSPDGTRLAANSWHGTVNIWDSGERRQKFKQD